MVESWDDYDTEHDLTQQGPWPQEGPNMFNGAHMIPTEGASTGLQDAIHAHAVSPNLGGAELMVFFYSVTSPQITSVGHTESAYGGRDAKWVYHYKYFRHGASLDHTKALMREHAQAVDATQPCKGFYNYADREFPCAGGDGDAWLKAHFSDVPRMRAIKSAEDPGGRFMSAFKAQMWS